MPGINSTPDAAQNYRGILLAKVTAVNTPASGALSGRPVYDWTEQGFDPLTGQSQDATPPRAAAYVSATSFSNCLIDANDAVLEIPSYVWIRMKGAVTGQTVYETAVTGGTSLGSDCSALAWLNPDTDCLTLSFTGAATGRCSGIDTSQTLVLVSSSDTEWIGDSQLTLGGIDWDVSFFLPDCDHQLPRLQLSTGSGSGLTTVCLAWSGCGSSFSEFTGGGAILCVGTSGGACADGMFKMRATCDPVACTIPNSCCPGLTFPKRLCLNYTLECSDTPPGPITFTAVLVWNASQGGWIGSTPGFGGPYSILLSFVCVGEAGISWTVVFFGTDCEFGGSAATDCDTPLPISGSGTTGFTLHGEDFCPCITTDPLPYSFTVADAADGCDVPQPPDPSWNCDTGACVDPGDGTGAYPTLLDCEIACGVTPTWKCDFSNNCVDPGDGSGPYASLAACEAVCSGGLPAECCPDSCGISLTLVIVGGVDAGSYVSNFPYFCTGSAFATFTISGTVFYSLTCSAINGWTLDRVESSVITGQENASSHSCGPLALAFPTTSFPVGTSGITVS